MVIDSQRERLAFLSRVVGKEAKHLAQTQKRLFSTPFTIATVETLNSDTDLSEQVDAFVSRFGRLQDTLGDKLIPTFLVALGERKAPVIETLDRAEQFGWINSVDD